MSSRSRWRSPSTAEVDAAFARLLSVLMGYEGVTPAVATHDPDLIELTRQLARQRRQPFEFQMLYGVRPQAQKELAAAGFPIRIYVPYGSSVVSLSGSPPGGTPCQPGLLPAGSGQQVDRAGSRGAYPGRPSNFLLCLSTSPCPTRMETRFPPPTSGERT